MRRLAVPAVLLAGYMLGGVMPAITIGTVIGLLVLIVCVVLVLIGQLEPRLGVLIGLLGLARVVP